MRALAGVLVGLVACSQPSEDASTLYRGSVLDGNARIHIASFDAAESAAYNWENCLVAQALFQNQPRVETKFWCEKGRFTK